MPGRPTGAVGPAVIVRDLAEGRVALEAARRHGVALTAVSAPEAGRFAGALWWRGLRDALAAESGGAEVRAILDCGDSEGSVLAALRAGVTEIVFTRPGSSARALAAIAREVGASLRTARPPALDLAAQREPRRALEAWMTAGPEPEA